jgi:dienelactone hydrolase
MISFSKNLGGWQDVGEQMRGDLQHQVWEYSRAREAEKAVLKNVADFENYREKIRAHFLEAIGDLPQEKTPLQPQITGVIQQDGFCIEKTLFQSQPDYLVSAACYVPDGLSVPAPGVLFLCGHSDNGKAHEHYQKVARDLARNGFVVLAIDPIGQGERLQYWENDEAQQTICTFEHTHAGFPFVLMGASVARHFVWDAIRGFDYLAGRGDVDETRIAATGNSGGGTQTCYLMLAEPRLAAAIPATFPMTLESMQQTGMVQDMEQIVAQAISRGPDHDDFLTALAPKPVLLGAVAYDAFPIEGSHEAIRRARKIYELYGQTENAQINVDETFHSYSDGTRQACVNWLKKHLKNEAPDFVTDPAMETLPAEELNATSSGQVLLDFPNSKTITDLTREYLRTLPMPNSSPEKLRAELDAVLGVSKTSDRSAPIYPRVMDPEENEAGESFRKIWFFSAPGVAVSGVLCAPRGAKTETLPTTILLLENGTSEDYEARVQKLLAENRRVFVFDVRGIGGVEARPVCPNCSSAPQSPFNSEYKMACDALMLGRSTPGARVFDVLRAFDYLQTREEIGEILIHGVGDAASWAFFAAALEADFVEVTCEEMLASYRDLCGDPHYDHTRFDLKIMPWGLLRVGDVTDFLPLIQPRPLRFIAPLDPRGAVLSAEKLSGRDMSHSCEGSFDCPKPAVS